MPMWHVSNSERGALPRTCIQIYIELIIPHQISKFVIDQVMFEHQLQNVLFFQLSRYELLKYGYVYLYFGVGALHDKKFADP